MIPGPVEQQLIPVAVGGDCYVMGYRGLALGGALTVIDFPASPTIGQQFTAAGVTWTWDGAKWLPSGLSPTVVPGIRDNRIINGDMRIDQRNGGASGTACGLHG